MPFVYGDRNIEMTKGKFRKSLDKLRFGRNERLNNYGTYGVWKQLYKANTGATLILPEKLGKVRLPASMLLSQPAAKPSILLRLAIRWALLLRRPMEM